jgi:predicted DNA-binding transcriptional regulator AlpA
MATSLARRLLYVADLEALTGATRKTIRAWVRGGLFPAPLPLGRGKHRWSARQVERVLDGLPAVGGRKSKS